jgi:hypothetical protein
MRVYCWKLHPVAVVEDISFLIRRSLKSPRLFAQCWNELNLITRYQPVENSLAPGDAMYFIGGHSSLQHWMYFYKNYTVKTNNQNGLVMTAEDNIKMSDGDRLAGYLKHKLKNHSGDEMTQEMKTAWNEVRRRTITCLCLYNSDRDNLQEPATPYKDKMIGDHITLMDISAKLPQFFSNLGVAQIRAKVEARVASRQRAVDKLFSDLNIDD